MKVQATIYLIRGISAKTISDTFKRQWENEFKSLPASSHLKGGLLQFPPSSIHVDGENVFIEAEMTEREILQQSGCDSIRKFLVDGGWTIARTPGEYIPLSLDGCLVETRTGPDGKISEFIYQRDGVPVASRSPLPHELESEPKPPLDLDGCVADFETSGNYKELFGVKYRRDGVVIAHRSATEREVKAWRDYPASMPIFGIKIGDKVCAPMSEINEPPKLRRVKPGDPVSSYSHNAIVDAIEGLQRQLSK